jgi:UDP-N-acetyl-D-mannosaminuronic acid dehydrogenase
VDHDEFLVIDRESLEGKQVIDTKGIWKQSESVDSARAHVPVGAGASG